MADGRALIDGLRGTDGGLDRQAIRGLLPYGDDFLFVDQVIRLDERQIETRWRIPDHAPYLDGHFRGLPVMPGALMREAFAQAGSLLVRYHLESSEDADIVGTHVESARFLSPALPGDLLTFEVHLKTLSRRAAGISTLTLSRARPEPLRESRPGSVILRSRPRSGSRSGRSRLPRLRLPPQHLRSP